MHTADENAVELYPFVEGDEIHQKMQSMLAASAALKPTRSSVGTNHAAKTTSRTTWLNLFSRVAAWFIQVFRKRGATRRSEKREHKKGSPDHTRQTRGARPVISGPLELLPPDDVEIRANEGLGSSRALCEHDAESAASAEQEQGQEVRLQVPREGESVKKHPSPGIAELEALHRQLELGQKHDSLIDSE